MDFDQYIDKEKKLKKMRLIATSLLILMAVIYIVFKRLEHKGLLFSSIVAFSEASMVGALADWFAVSALFRHPLGMSWIPHTAIIPKSRDKIGESIGSFVVSNFFTEQAIEGKLQNIKFTGNISGYLIENKAAVSAAIAENLPEAAKSFFNTAMPEIIVREFKEKLAETRLHPILEKLLPAILASGMHVTLLKQLLEGTYTWVSENKYRTLKAIENMNKTLTLPFVGDITYKALVNVLSKLSEDIGSDEAPDFNKELLQNLPAKLVKDFSTSVEMKERVEGLKAQILASEAFNNFIDEKVIEVKNSVIDYTVNSREELEVRISQILDSMVSELLSDETVREKIDDLIRKIVVNVVCSYKHEIAGLIKETVDNWPMNDLVQKLELQVGGDLQYIRINGTVIGGIAGLAIHLVSHVLG